MNKNGTLKDEQRSHDSLKGSGVFAGGFPTAAESGIAKKRISYASAPCGSGKTHQLIVRACLMASRHKMVLIAQPTIELIGKTVEELAQRPDRPVYRVFHGGTVGSERSVATELAAYLKDCDVEGQIVFTTHQALLYLPYLARKGSWHLLIDEELQILKTEARQIPTTHPIISQHLDIQPVSSVYGKTVIKNFSAFKELAQNLNGDELLESLRPALRLLSDKNWDSFVNIEQYERLLGGSGRQLTFHSVLKTNIFDDFASVLIASANFENSLQYNLWSNRIKFASDSKLTNALRYKSHSNGDQITIHYLLDEDWSKKRALTIYGDRTILDTAIEAVKKLFGDAPFAWQANAWMKDKPFGQNGHRLPNAPHGLNSFLHLHNLAFFSALNPTPDQCKFLSHCGLSQYAIRAGGYYATAYQSAMRTSIRNPNDDNPKRIVVPDLGVAEFLQGLFPGSRIEQLDIGIPRQAPKGKGGRPKHHANNAERLAAQRRKAKAELLRSQFGIVFSKNSQDASGASDIVVADPRIRAETGIDINSPIGSSPCHGSIFTNKFSKTSFDRLDVDEQSFVELLRQRSAVVCANKDCNLLISPALFDPNLSAGTSRGKVNILFLRNIWLDFENGDLLPDEFPRLFPHWKIIVTNSFNHHRDNPRYRVIILTNDHMSVEAYELIYDNVVAKLRDAGYWVKGTWKWDGSQPRSGLDVSKRAANSLFYLPCQAQNPANSFFRYYEDRRQPIDVANCVLNSVVPSECRYELPQSQSQSVNHALVDAAIDRWRCAPEGDGNHRFFMLGWELQRAGMEIANIEATLKVEAKYGRSPGERMRQIPTIMASLVRYGRQVAGDMVNPLT